MPEQVIEIPDIPQALRERVEMMRAAAENTKLCAALWKTCETDIVFFVEHFCWFDRHPEFYPDLTIPAVPAKLFGYQKEFLREAVRCIETRQPLFIEKTRQMGLSWLMAFVFVYGLIFRNWKLKVISRNGAEVDKLGDINSFMEKCRYVIRKMPGWLLPDGFNPSEDMGAMLIKRADGTGVIVGETANPNASRGGTFHAILMDEMAFIPYAKSINSAAAFATGCTIYLSTPNGETNEYFRMRKQAYSGHIQGLRYHWTEHPFYTKEWYARKCREIGDPVKIAQELDIDYTGSVAGRVYPQFRSISAGGDIRIGKYEYDSSRPVVVSIDHSHGGQDPNAVIVWQLPKKPGGNLTIIRSLLVPAAPELCASLLAKRPETGWIMPDDCLEFFHWWRDVRDASAFIADPYDTNAAMLSTTIAREYAKRGITLQIPKDENDKISHPSSRIVKLRGLLRRLEVNEDETDFMSSMANAAYKTDKEGKMKDNPEPEHDDTSHFRTAAEYFGEWYAKYESKLTERAVKTIFREVADPVTGVVTRKAFQI